MCTFLYTIKLIYRLNLMNYYRIKYLIEYIEKAYLNAFRCYFLNQLEKKLKMQVFNNRCLIEFTLWHQLNAYLLHMLLLRSNVNYFPLFSHFFFQSNYNVKILFYFIRYVSFN